MRIENDGIEGVRMNLPRVVLRARRNRPFYARHPWVFAGAIAAVHGDPADGAEVDLHSSTDQFIARGLYNSQSKVRVRLYQWQPDQPLDGAFFRDRLAAAIRLRRDCLGLDGPGRACRLVFSEADGLSGLTVDRYDRWLVIQFTALGLAQRRDDLVAALVELTGTEGVYLRTERGIGKLEGLALQDGPLWGTVPTEPILIDEAGLGFRVHLTEGQKTGFYLDQRDNRQAVAQLARGRRMLDAFCYTGGFGLHAARAGAAEVIGVEASAPALALARANVAHNSLERISFVEADVFDDLDQRRAAGERFGMVVLDPPKFARNQNAVEDALRGYRRLQTHAIQLLEPEGLLITCCCTGLITRDMLGELLSQLAVEMKRDIQVLELRGPTADHPVSVACPESDYLKCIIARVR